MRIVDPQSMQDLDSKSESKIKGVIQGGFFYSHNSARDAIAAGQGDCRSVSLTAGTPRR